MSTTTKHTKQTTHIDSHGHYPFDARRAASAWSWCRIRELTPEAAADMLGCMPVETWSDTEPNRNLDRVGGPAIRQRGFVVLRLRHNGVVGVPPLQHAENVTNGEESLPYEFQHGDEAVYHEEGKYWVIRGTYQMDGRYSHHPLRPSQMEITTVSYPTKTGASCHTYAVRPGQPAC